MSETQTPPIKMIDVRVGDSVGRQVGEDGPLMWLTVTEVDEVEEVIRCNLWTFDRLTGAEIDDELQWGPKYGRTGSYIRMARLTS